jgi:hypothetical protein
MNSFYSDAHVKSYQRKKLPDYVYMTSSIYSDALFCIRHLGWAFSLVDTRKRKCFYYYSGTTHHFPLCRTDLHCDVRQDWRKTHHSMHGLYVHYIVREMYKSPARIQSPTRLHVELQSESM